MNYRSLYLSAVVASAVVLSMQFSPGHRVSAADNPAEKLTLDRIFNSKDFDEQRVGSFQWSRLSNSYFSFEKENPEAKFVSLMRINIETGAKEVVIAGNLLIPPGSEQPLAVQRFQFTQDESKLLIYTNSQKVWRQNTRGDYWLFDLKQQKLTKLGGTTPPAQMMFAKISPDQTKVAFVYVHNLYVQSLTDWTVTPLTTDGSETLINGTSDWVNEEELAIRDGWRWSPDSQSIAFYQFDTTGVPRFTMIDHGQQNYPKVITFPYPKVGEKNSSTRIGVINISGGKPKWIELPGDPREHYIPQVEWTPAGGQLLIQQMNRPQNRNVVSLADVTSGKLRTVMTEVEETWIENDNPVKWLAGGKEFLWISERSGWRHVYRANLESGELVAITQGAFDVIDVEAIDETKGILYFAASPENPTQRYLYQVPLRGGDIQRVTPAGQSGWHTYQIAPSFEVAIHTFSNLTTPPLTEVVRLPSHEVVRTLADNQVLKDKLAQWKFPQPELFRVDIGNGIELDGWRFAPTLTKGEKQHPLFLHVYGEPHGQVVRDVWMGKRGFWYSMLAQEGYIVAAVDNRGTMSPRGRDFRKCVYKQIGLLASQEQALAVKALLAKWPFADPDRVGIWGWSGGGSMSLNALFRYPEIYKMAIAVAPMPNQKLYDTIYQERYMGLLSDNEEGYKQGSPTTFAKQLQGDLLLIHGTGDDNCHYQATEQLMNELIAHGKQFSVMPYPSRSHSISEGRGTNFHLYQLMTNYIHEKLPLKSSPASEKAPVPVAVADKTQPGISQASKEPVENAESGAEAYDQALIQGWTVRIHRQLKGENPEKLKKALELLEAQLKEVVQVVPPMAVQELKKVTIWLSPEYKGIPPKAVYHPSRQWLVANNRLPEMARAVEFTNVRIFEEESRRMPNITLHELAHAYHDRVLKGGYGNAEIIRAYEAAKESGKYEQVEQRFGNGRSVKTRAYAMTSPMEYFSESSEAYFSTNDFFPFNREELVQHDPSLVPVLKELWGER